MKVTTIFLITLLLVNCSCKKKKNQIDDDCTYEIKISLEENNNSHKESDFVEDFEIIPLSSEENVIGQIGEIKIVRDTLFISDLDTHSIYLYALENGQYIQKIEGQGKGAGEFLRIDDFYVDENLKYIEILDSALKRILRYDLEGNFLKDIDVPYSFSGMERLKDHIVFSKDIAPSSEKWMYQLIVTDTLINVVEKNIEVGKEESIDIVFAPNQPLDSYKGNVSFQPVYKPVIYSVNEKLEIKPKYCLNFGDLWPQTDLLYNKKGLQPFQFMKDIYQSGSAYFINFLEGDDHAIVYFSLYEDNEPYLNIFNKKNGQSKTLKTKNSNLCLGNEYLDFYKGYFISIKQPYSVIEYARENKNELPESIEKTISTLKEQDNPVLVLTKFK